MSTISLNLSEHILDLLCLCEKIHQIYHSKFQIKPNGFYVKWTYAKMALSQMTQTHLGWGLATTVTEKATFQNERNRQVHILTVKGQVPCGVWLVRLKPYYTILLFTSNKTKNVEEVFSIRMISFIVPWNKIEYRFFILGPYYWVDSELWNIFPWS